MKNGVVTSVTASVGNMLTVYSSIFVYQPFSCQNNFHLIVPFLEYKRFVLQAGKEGLMQKIFAASEAERYQGLIDGYNKHKQTNQQTAENFFRFYYLNDLLRLGASEIRRAYERGANPTWFVGDFGTDEELDCDDLLKYALSELHKLSNHSGCQAKVNEIKDIAYLRSVSIDSYRAYVFYVLVSMWNTKAPKVRF